MKKVSLFFVICACVLTACAPRRDLVYFSNLAKLSSDEKLKAQEVKIQQNDLLSISVNSLNQESNVLFAANKPSNSENSYRMEGYRVNKEGSINLPVAGNIRLEGLTTEEAQLTITKELEKYIKKPVVDVQLVNFKVTVIGEVNKQSSFTIPENNINLLEALGMAGDMTPYGKRENVLVIREQNGQRSMKRLNLNDQDVMNSPFFYLKQNDIVYVEPDKSKAIEYSPNTTRLMPILVASISAVAVLITAVLNK